MTLPTPHPYSPGSADLAVSIGAILFESHRETVILPGGRSMPIAEVLGDVPELREHELIVISQDRVVKPDQWPSYVHDHDTPLFINVIPKNRRILRLIAFVALAVFAPQIGSALVGAGASTFAKLVATTLVQIVGAIAIEKLLGEKPPGSIETDPQRYGVSGIQNSFPGRQTPVPVIMGKHRITPYFACQPYAYVASPTTQGYRALFDCGYGPLEFDRDSFRFGDQPVANFPNAMVTTIPGSPGAASRIAAFSERHDQRNLVRELLANEANDGPGEWQVFEYGAGVTRIDMIVVFNGLINIDRKGKRHDVTVTLEVAHRRGAGAWSSAVEHVATGQTTSEYFFAVNTAVDNRGGEIRIRRKSPGHKEDNQVTSDSFLSAVDFITPQPPVEADGRALAFVQVVANENLNNTVNSFNCIATRLVSRHDGSRWLDPSTVEADNPAWLFASILRGPGMAMPQGDDLIDDAGLRDLAAHCKANGYGYNGVWTDQRSVWDRLNQVASAGRGSATFRNGAVYSVVIDRKKTVPIDLITPRDAISFQGEKSFETAPHAFRASFANAADSYRESEITVYRDGFDAASAIDVRSIDATAAGATTVEQVHRFLRYLLAVAVLRPEAFTVRQDVKNLRLDRGDYVELQYDAPLVGLGSGRLVKTSSQAGRWTGFSLDERIELREGERHQARFQELDGTSRVVSIAHVPDQEIAAATVAGNAVPTLGN